MRKIEDIKIKNLENFLKPKNLTVNKNRKEYISLFFKFNFILVFIVLSWNVVAAPLNNSSDSSKNLTANLQNQILDPEKKQKKESLEAELQKVLNQIKEYQKTISGIQKQKRSIKNDIAITESNIKKVELEIKAIDLSIKKLNQKITETKKSIQITEQKIEKSREVLTASLRYYYQLKQRSIVEVFVAQARLSNYFNNFFYVQKLQEQINSEIDNLKDLNNKLAIQKSKLETELKEQADLLGLQKIKYAELQDLKKEKQMLLAQAQKEESKYQKLLKESEKTAAEIREQIYRLAGGSGAITFGEAYNLAKIVEKYTGVRPAFLLAILHYESKLGQNVGTCHYKDAMKPSEQPIFEQIVNELGLDPNKMPVSCKPWYGWGGAMGPAQFIPSTWMGYRDRVAKLTGNNPPSPWNNLDAFTAAAIKLSSDGADARTYYGEWKAAMIYFAGSNWNKPSLSFYGDDVMAIASRFQEDINVLEKGQ